jgi:hypothetical protein
VPPKSYLVGRGAAKARVISPFTKECYGPELIDVEEAGHTHNRYFFLRPDVADEKRLYGDSLALAYSALGDSVRSAVRQDLAQGREGRALFGRDAASFPEPHCFACFAVHRGRPEDHEAARSIDEATFEPLLRTLVVTVPIVNCTKVTADAAVNAFADKSFDPPECCDLGESFGATLKTTMKRDAAAAAPVCLTGARVVYWNNTVQQLHRTSQKSPVRIAVIALPPTL